ncbi:transposase [Streptomyces europaeiscabiei]|nr:transposase [Streptomyces europaeiscabiei]
MQRLQFFLSESPWEAERVNDRRLELLREESATAPHEGGVIVIDDSGDRKDGTATAHVGRQWLGRLGKTDKRNRHGDHGVDRRPRLLPAARNSRYRWTEDVADLDTAVHCYQAALHFPEIVPADRAHLQNNLAFALWRRYQAGGPADDLEHARRRCHVVGWVGF